MLDAFLFIKEIILCPNVKGDYEIPKMYTKAQTFEFLLLK
jgi:hypothetical protein